MNRDQRYEAAVAAMDDAFGLGKDRAHEIIRTTESACRIYDCAIIALMSTIEGDDHAKQQHLSMREQLKVAIGHLEHMSAWIGNHQPGSHARASTYSFEALGEDMPNIRAAAGLDAQPRKQILAIAGLKEGDEA